MPGSHSVQTAIATAPWYADIAKYAVGGAIGLVGTMIGRSGNTALQRERFRREDRGLLAHAEGLLFDVVELASVTARTGYYQRTAWDARIKRLNEALDSPAFAAAFRNVQRYERLMRSVGEMERAFTIMTSDPDCAPITAEELREWDAGRGSRRRLMRHQWDTHYAAVARELNRRDVSRWFEDYIGGYAQMAIYIVQEEIRISNGRWPLGFRWPSIRWGRKALIKATHAETARYGYGLEPKIRT